MSCVDVNDAHPAIASTGMAQSPMLFGTDCYRYRSPNDHTSAAFSLTAEPQNGLVHQFKKNNTLLYTPSEFYNYYTPRCPPPEYNSQHYPDRSAKTFGETLTAAKVSRTPSDGYNCKVADSNSYSYQVDNDKMIGFSHAVPTAVNQYDDMLGYPVPRLSSRLEDFASATESLSASVSGLSSFNQQESRSSLSSTCPQMDIRQRHNHNGINVKPDRVRKACLNCHRRKTGCSEYAGTPCAKCVKKGLECVYPDFVRKRGKARSPKHKHLAYQV
jgi:hypothetical protein